ncbi:uncharacterized protein LOC123537031 [Mercenaria mercenaria]|uniref:uncharacterized protein LOC123537031 n=1 Tax=Mercenaria mercenaria TaxID=6596 RepID=UPI00234F3451|nr:uncharacterized protein LOC123537031 [Mercenaria mercenaria]
MASTKPLTMIDTPEGRKWVCEICGMTLKKRPYLKQHLKRWHRSNMLKDNSSTTLSCTNKHAVTNTEETMLEEIEDDHFQNGYMDFINSIQDSTGECLIEVKGDFDESENTLSNRDGHITDKSERLETEKIEKKIEKVMDVPQTDVITDKTDQLLNRHTENTNIDIVVLSPDSMIVNTPERRRVSCDICEKTFKKLAYLNRHLKCMHGPKTREDYISTAIHSDDRYTVKTNEKNSEEVNDSSFNNDYMSFINSVENRIGERLMEVTDNLKEAGNIIPNRDVHTTDRNQHVNADSFEATSNYISATNVLISDRNDDLLENEMNVSKTDKRGNPQDKNASEIYDTVKRYICDHCQTTFKKSIYLTRHLKSRHNLQKSEDKEYRTVVSQKKVDTRKNLVVQGTYNCEFCPMTCRKKSYLLKHVKRKHNAVLQRSRDECLNEVTSHVDQTAKDEVGRDLVEIEKFTTDHVEKEMKVFQLDVQFDSKNDVLNRNMEIVDTGHKVISARSVVKEGCSLGDMIVSMKDFIGDVQIKPENIEFELKGRGMKLKVMYQ